MLITFQNAPLNTFLHLHVIEYGHANSKNHVNDAENDRQLHFKGVQENNFVGSQLKIKSKNVSQLIKKIE